MRAIVDTPPLDPQPDWERLRVDLLCPRCGYNMRMLTEPRCPECGLRSTWRELVAAAEQRTLSPLFEYQWRRRPVRSFIRTLGESMLPWMIWQTATLTAKPRIRPLIAMLVVTLALGAGLFASIAIGVELSGVRSWASGWPRIPLATWVLVGCNWGLCIGGMHLLLALCLLVSAMVLQETLHAYRIRPGHLVRISGLTVIGMLGWFMLAWCARLLCDIAPGVLSRAATAWIERLPELLSLTCLVASTASAWTLYLGVRRGILDAVLVGVLATVLMSTVVYAVIALSTPGSAWEAVPRLCEAFWPMTWGVIQWIGGTVLGFK